GDGEAPRRQGVVEHEQAAPQGQGLHRLEPELASQDDDLRILVAGPTAADGVDTGDVGRGRRGGRWRPVVVHRYRGTRTRRAARRPLGTDGDVGPGDPAALLITRRFETWADSCWW